MMDFSQSFSAGLTYNDFVGQYASDTDRQRWEDVYKGISLDERQTGVLGSFVRDMKVVVLAGAWCGDCVNQCPIFERFSEANGKIQVRYLDRDDHPDLTAALTINGGQRVPVVVFLSEDDYLCGVFGDRTLAKYRTMAADTDSEPASQADQRPLIEQATDEWLNEFERMQLMMRTSGRLRKIHGD